MSVKTTIWSIDDEDVLREQLTAWSAQFGVDAVGEGFLSEWDGPAHPALCTISSGRSGAAEFELSGLEEFTRTGLPQAIQVQDGSFFRLLLVQAVVTDDGEVRSTTLSADGGTWAAHVQCALQTERAALMNCLFVRLPAA